MVEMVGLAPRQTVSQMIHGFKLSHAVCAAARLGVADLLADGPRSCLELARATGTRAPLLRRLLRMLASAGVFAEVEPGVFGLTPEAGVLRDTPGSLRASVLLWVELGKIAWGDLVGVVRTGQTGYQLATGMREWEYYARHPEAGAVFDAAMTAFSQPLADAVVAAYDFPAAGTVVDVAGGRGALLAAILRARPALRGVLFDQPHVVAGAPAVLEAAGVADRCAVVGGDFFRAVPDGGDVYTLKWILHDWDDERAAAILHTCRGAMGERGALLVLEHVMPDGPAARNPECFDACRADLDMMAWTGGRERTADEFRALLGAAGFHLRRMIPASPGLHLLEASPA
jgi:hypothetical protein